MRLRGLIQKRYLGLAIIAGLLAGAGFLLATNQSRSLIGPVAVARPVLALSQTSSSSTTEPGNISGNSAAGNQSSTSEPSLTAAPAGAGPQIVPSAHDITPVPPQPVIQPVPPTSDPVPLADDNRPFTECAVPKGYQEEMVPYRCANPCPKYRFIACIQPL